jgi:hypothetical protein
MFAQKLNADYYKAERFHNCSGIQTCLTTNHPHTNTYLAICPSIPQTFTSYFCLHLNPRDKIISFRKYRSGKHSYFEIINVCIDSSIKHSDSYQKENKEEMFFLRKTSHKLFALNFTDLVSMLQANMCLNTCFVYRYIKYKHYVPQIHSRKHFYVRCFRT